MCNARRFFLRSDGLVDRSTGFGKIDKTFQSLNHSPYIAISSQFVGQGSENDDGANNANYLVRADGLIERVVMTRNVETQIPPPHGTKYIAASAMQTACKYPRCMPAVRFVGVETRPAASASRLFKYSVFTSRGRSRRSNQGLRNDSQHNVPTIGCALRSSQCRKAGHISLAQ